MLRAVIFDVDGTLLDSVDQHAEAWKAAFAHFGHQFPLEDVRYQIGKGGDKLLEMFLNPQEIQDRGAEIERFRGKLFRKEYAGSLRGFPKVPELFGALKDKGLKTGLATSGKRKEVDGYLKLLGIEGVPDTITTKDDVENSKPDPDVLVVTRSQLGQLAASECVFIGDSPHDATAAKHDGMRMIGLLCGGFPERDLREAGASEIFEDPDNLLARWVPTL